MQLKAKDILIHLTLFILTFITTTMAGAEWVHGKTIFAPGYSWQDFLSGVSYSIPFLFILTVHEFGHYFTAVYYKVRTSLPYYIPLPSLPNLPLMLGTLGALIRLKERVPSKKQNFDIGIAGPLAGFVATLGVLWYGFSHLPPPEYIFQFHPEYEQFGLNYANFVYLPEHLPPNSLDVVLGKNLLFIFFENYVADPVRVPNVHEIMHYPFLLAGFLSLIFTSINLLPIGQLDGGHVLYGLLGFKGHRIVASVVFIAFLFYAGLGLVGPGSSIAFFSETPSPITALVIYTGFLYVCLSGLKWGWKNQLMIAVMILTLQYLLATFLPGLKGYSGWLLFVFLIGRLMGVQHPPAEIEEPLSMDRKILGWISLAVFIICFTPYPIEFFAITPAAP